MRPTGDLTESHEYLEFDTKEDKQGITLTQSYVYDAVGRPTEVTYKQGEAVKKNTRRAMTAVTISQRAAIPTDTAIRPKHSIEPMPTTPSGG